MMDAFWADGWRHFGSTFFRDMFSVVGNRFCLVIPLRVDVTRCVLSESQRRVLRKNEDVQVMIADASPDMEKRRLFDIHKRRFRDNVPESLADFLSPVPSLVPGNTLECCVYDNERLVAVSFFDAGGQACSSVYAAFDPDIPKRSLGIFTLLHEIRYARESGRRWLYLGYGHREHSHYDYKKNFHATEFYNWKGEWLPLEQLAVFTPDPHPIERVDVDMLLSSLRAQ